MAKFDEKWFRLNIDRAGYSLRQFAFAVGLDPSSLNRTLTGKRRLQLDEAEKMAGVMGQSVEDVIAHAGIKLSGAIGGAKVEMVHVPGKAPLGGRVDSATGAVTFEPTKASAKADVVALAIGGDPFMAGWRVLCAPGEVGAPGASGIDAGVVQLQDGSLLLRKVRPAFAPGRFDLGPVFGFGGRENDVEVVGVIPVVGLER